MEREKLTGYMKAVSEVGYTLYLIRGAADCLRDYNSSLIRDMLDIYDGIKDIARKKDMDPTIRSILKPYRKEAVRKELRSLGTAIFFGVLIFLTIAIFRLDSCISSGLSVMPFFRAALGSAHPASYNVNDDPYYEYVPNMVFGFITLFLEAVVITTAAALVIFYGGRLIGSLIRAVSRRVSSDRSGDTGDMVTCLNAYIASINVFDLCLDDLEEMEHTQLDLLASLLSLDVLEDRYIGYIPSTQIYSYLSDSRCSELEGENGAYALWESELASGLVADDICSAENMFRKNLFPETQLYLAAEIGEKLRFMGELFTYASSYRDMLEAQLDGERRDVPKRAALPRFDGERVRTAADSFIKKSVIADIASIAEQVCNEVADILSR